MGFQELPVWLRRALAERKRLPNAAERRGIDPLRSAVESLERRQYLTSGVLNEYWASVAGTAVANLTADTRYPAAPTSSVTLPTFEAQTNAGDNYGQRLRAYVTPTTSGSYNFYVAGDDAAQLYLSPDADPTHKTLVASTAAWTGVREWTKYASQQSAAVQLVAGQRYYIEVLHKENSGGDSLSVGWSGPGIAAPTVIVGSYLTAYVPPAVPAGPTLAAGWAFDEASGTTAADASGNNKTLTLVGGASFTAGRSGQALTLNGTNAYAKTASSPVLASNASYTVSAWVNWAGGSGNRAIISEEGVNRTAFSLQLRNGQPVLAANLTDATGTGASSAILYSWGAIPANTWHHVAGVYDAAAGQLRIYVDGVRQGSQAYAGSFNATGPTVVGAGLFNGARADYFGGQIDDARAYATAFTDAQVQQQYSGILPAQAATPATPENLSAATTTGEPTKVVLSWLSDSAEATFNIQRSINGTWTTIATTAAGARTYTDTGLTGGTTYSYRIAALTAAGFSPASSAVSATTIAPGASGLVAGWAFDQASGTTSTDSSGNGNTLSLAGGAGFATGRTGRGNALTLNGTSGYAKTSGTVVDSSASYTLSAWVNWNGGSGNRAIISEEGTNRSAFNLQLRNGQPVLAVNTTDAAGTGASSVIIWGWAVLPANTWHHVAGVYDAAAGKAYLYVDGVRQASSAFTGGFHANGQATVGAAWFNGARADYFGGQIDDAQVYSSALAETEIKAAAGIQVAAQALGGNGVRLTWEKPSASTSGYNILQSTDGQTYTQVATAAANAESALIEELDTSTVYSFKVVAVNASGTTLSTIGPVAVMTGSTNTSGYYSVSVVPGDAATNGVIPSHRAATTNTGVSSSGMTIIGGSGVQVYASDWTAAVYKVLSGSVSMSGTSYAFATSRRFRVETASKIAYGSTGVGLDTAGYGLTAADQVAGFEDGVDNDFNDYYFRVKATAVAAPAPTLSLTVQNQKSPIGQATNSTAYIPLNQNFDEGNHDGNSSPVPDNLLDVAAGDRILASDLDLRDATLTLGGPMGRWMLTFATGVKVWQLTTSGTYVPIVSGVKSAVISPQTIHFKIEGTEASGSTNDVPLMAMFESVTAGIPSALAEVDLTVVGIDSSVDSNNNDKFATPSGDYLEASVEDNAALPGKILYTGIVRRAPMSIFAKLPDTQLATAKFRISYDTAHLKLWRSATSQDSSLVLAPGIYTGNELGFGSGTADVTLYLQGLSITTATSQRLINIEMATDSADTTYMTSDSVYVSVRDGSTLPATIEGYKWNDKNIDGIRNADILSTPPDTVFVIDVSGSTLTSFKGGSAGDINADLHSNTVLDGEIQAFIALSSQIQKDFPDSSVGIVVFGTTAKGLDMNTVSPGVQLGSKPGDVVNSILSNITVGYQGVGNTTNYHDGLQSAIATARSFLSSGRKTNVFFLSDGYPNTPTSSPNAYISQVNTLRGPEFNANLEAFGVGTQSSLTALTYIDPAAKQFFDNKTLLSAFTDANSPYRKYTEPGISGWRVTAFVDVNGNGNLDVGETTYTTLTDGDGNYSLNVPAGTYVLQEESRLGYSQSAPQSHTYTVTVRAGDEVTANFGNYSSAKVNLDVDSDNTVANLGLPENNDHEEAVEDTDAARFAADAGDTDSDGIPGYADFQSAGTKFLPMILDMRQFATIDPNATIQLFYNGSDPSQMVGQIPAEGLLRVWKKSADQSRSVSDYIDPNATYTLASLGITDSIRSVTLWVEGIRPTSTLGDGAVTASVDLDGSGPTNTISTDTVHVAVQGSGAAGSVTGTVWLDPNNNAVHDASEGPAANVRVYIDTNGDGDFQSAEPSSLTNAAGGYAIAGVTPGSYRIYLNVSVSTHITAPTGAIQGVPIQIDGQMQGPDFLIHINQHPFFTSLPDAEYHINPYAPVDDLPSKPPVWGPGDFFVPLQERGNGTFEKLKPAKILEYDGLGNLVRVLSLPSIADGYAILGLVFDKDGNLFASTFAAKQNKSFGNVIEFDSQGRYSGVVKEFAIGHTPEGIRGDGLGDMLIADSHFNAFHEYLGDGGISEVLPTLEQGERQVPNREIAFFDLASDQHNIIFSNDTEDIYQLDLNTGIASPAPFNVPLSERRAFDLRILPDGGVLVADSEKVFRLDRNGAIIRSYGDDLDTNTLFGLGLDLDKKSFWVSTSAPTVFGQTTKGEGHIYRFDIETGHLLNTITLPDNPKVSSIGYFGEPAAAVIINEKYRYVPKAIDPDGDPLEYRLIGDTNGATIGIVDGVMEWTPRDIGTYSFTIEISDGQATETQSFSVSVDHDVSGPNHSPLITSTILSKGVAGITYMNRIIANDPDNDKLRFTLVDNADATIDSATGIIRFIPTQEQQAAGKAILHVRVEDGRGGSDEKLVEVPLAPVINSNHDPVIQAPPSIDLDALGRLAANTSQPFTYQVIATDVDGDHVQYIPVSLPKRMTLDSKTGLVSWSPSGDQVGDTTFTIGATDRRGGYSERTFNVFTTYTGLTVQEVVVAPYYSVNHPDDKPDVLDPTALLLGVKTNDREGQKTAFYTWSVTSPNGIRDPDILYTYDNNDFLSNPDYLGEVIRAQFYAAGTYTFNVTVEKNGLKSPMYSKQVIVKPVPKFVLPVPPLLAAHPNQKIDGLASYVIDQFQHNMDNPGSVTWKGTKLPSGGQVIHNVDDTWSYQAGPTESTADQIDLLTVSYTFTGTTLSATLPVVVDSTPFIKGFSSINPVATEGVTTTFSDDDSQSESFALGGFLDYAGATGNTPDNYTATIHWGDGTTSPGTVERESLPEVLDDVYHDQLFQVVGTHKYSHIGIFQYTVSITTADGRSVEFSAPDGTGVDVVAAPLDFDPVPISTNTWTPFTGEVASFSDPVGVATTATLLATIDWGDGTSTTGTVAETSPGKFAIIGSHTYAVTGNLEATVRVYERKGTSAELFDDYIRGTVSAKVAVTPAVLRPPTGVHVVAISTQQIEVTWDDSPDCDFLILRRNPDGSTTTLPPVEGGLQPSPDSPYFDANLTPGTKYTYSVVSVDHWGNRSSPSEAITVGTWSTAKVPSSVVVTPIAGPGVKIDWADGRNDESDPSAKFISGWKLLRADGDGTNNVPDQSKFKAIFDYELTAPVAVDRLVQPNTDYWYEVVAVEHAEENSAPSEAKRVQTGVAPGLANPPTNLIAGYAGQASSTSGGPGRVGLHWDSIADSSLLGFDVYRSTTSNFALDSTTKIGEAESSGPFFVDDIAVGSNYYYAVCAVYANSLGGEVYSTPAYSAKVDTSVPPAVPPLAPTGLRAFDVTADHVSLLWTDTSVTETEFEVYRRGHGSTTWSAVGRVTADQATFTDTTVTPSSDYDYKVSAHNSAGEADSNTIEVTTPSAGPAPLPPTSVALDPLKTTITQIGLTWTAPTGPTGVVVGGYRVYRRVHSATTDPWAMLTPTPITTTSFVDVNAIPLVAYDYQVRAISTANSPSDSAEKDNLTTLSPPPDAAPTATLTTPGNFTGISVSFNNDDQQDGRLRKLTSVKAFVNDINGDLVSWSLVLRPTDRAANTVAADIPLAKGNGPIGALRNPDGTLVYPDGEQIAVLDPTQFPNGEYQLVLTATDAGGRSPSPSIVKVSLYSQTKLGNLTLPVTDLQIDVPGGQPVIVRRTYDSQKANVLGDFGYGWTLDASGTDLQTTARPGTGVRGKGAAFRPGDIVYVTLPGQGQHAFQFWPVPNNYDPQNPAGRSPYGGIGTYSHYWIQFLAVDGSNATLTVPGDIHEPRSSKRIDLVYDSVNNEFFDQLTNQAYDPKVLGNNYEIESIDGSTFNVNATTGQLQNSTDANGNVTSYGPNGVSENGLQLKIERNGPRGTVSKVYLVDGNGAMVGQPVTYSYDTAAGPSGLPKINLTSVTDRVGQNTTYGYDTTSAARVHYLTTVTNALNVTTLAAEYNDPINRLTKLTDGGGNAATVTTPSSDGSTGSQSASAPDGSKTQTIYNDHGDVARTIQAIRDTLGNVAGYSVTVHTYEYNTRSLTDEISQIFRRQGVNGNGAGLSAQNTLLGEAEYQPMVVGDLNAAMTIQPGDAAFTAKRARETKYELDPTNLSDPDRSLPASETVLAADGVTELTTTFSAYVNGKPQHVVDSYGNHTDSTYDIAGNLKSTTTAAGTSAAETTYYSYTGGAETGTDGKYHYADGTTVDYTGIPKGLPLETWQLRGSGTGQHMVVTSKSVYYTSGASKSRLLSTTDAAGLITRYTYTQTGQTEDVFREWRDAANVFHSVHDSHTVYDADDRPTAVTDADGQTTQTYYDAVGRVAVTVDAFGGQTLNAYDARGLLIRTLSPDGTETRTAYDSLGRAEWTSDRFAGASACTTTFNGSIATVTWTNEDNTAAYVVTHTTYDSLGRVAGTERYRDAQITIGTTAGQLQTTGPDVAALTAAGRQLNTSRTIYDAAGRTVETIATGALVDGVRDADGSHTVRVGTVYYANGQVRFRGTLPPPPALGQTDPLPVDWYTRTNAQTYFLLDPFSGHGEYTEYKYDQNDANVADPITGNSARYDATIDPLGHETRTYKDGLGRQFRTKFADGSYVLAFTSVNGQAITSANTPTLPSGVVAPTSAEGWAGVPDGGSETIEIGQRKDGQTPPDPLLATYKLYDVSGRLTDVWLPAVDDATTAAADLVRPHWHYTYDVNGNQLTQVDPKGHVTSFAYDDRKRRTSRTLPAVGGTTATETWTYDDRGRPLTHTDFDGQTTAWVYDTGTAHTGRLTDEYRFAAGVTAVDGSGNVETANAAERTAFGYDDLGRKGTVNEYVGGLQTRHTAYGYDFVTGGQTLADTPEGQIHHAYDPATGRLTRTWTPHNDTTYEYDNQGRLDHVIGTELNDQTANSVTDYAYDGAGDLHATTQENGTGSADDVVTTYGYDTLNRLTDEVVTRGGSATLFSQHYILQDDGQKKSVLEQTADGQTVFTTWTYDGDGRLRVEARDVGNDALNSVAGDQILTFGYDLSGNRRTQVVDKPNTVNDQTIASAYDERDRLTASGPDANVDGLPDAGTATTYGYDANGSTIIETTNGQTKRYVWDLRSRLAGLNANGNVDTNGKDILTDAGDATFIYDADGVRVGESVVGGASTVYLQDTNNPTGYSQVLEETTTPATGPATRRSYVIGNSVIAQADGSAVSTLLYDGGSTRAILDATGQVATSQVAAYDAFGVTIQGDSIQTALRYRGQYLDSLLGQYQLRARYYDPTTGTFRSFDPAENDAASPMGLHKYLYADGNPINMSDPSGHFSIPPGISRWVQKNLAKGIALDLIVRALIGIRATYVIGNEYIDENYGGDLISAQNVSINRQIFTSENLPDIVPDGVNLFLRPDIVDYNPIAQTVYEVKTEGTAFIGRTQLAGYIALLDLRYPGETFTPGNWQPSRRFLNLDLPYFGIPLVPITIRNAGGGVIAYDAGNAPELIAIGLRLAYEVKKGVAVKSGADSARMDDQLGLATLLGFIGLV